MRGDSALLLSCLDMQQAFKDVLIPMEAQHRNLQAESNRLQTELTQARRDMEQLENEVANLVKERPDQYIHWKRRFLKVMHHARNKFQQWLENAKRVCRWLWEKRRTHPY
jgi:predicted RNase H-like nuclease (RuvC/YqgF family)